jgi:2-amino-4-hydroxy-6-hydroxymethyldihydropteridine diphosphokinase/dihydropteroate synthase
MIALGLGSNLGDPVFQLRRAIDALAGLRDPQGRPMLTDLRVSPPYLSDALLPEGAPQAWDHPFVNVVVIGRSDRDPHEVLRATRAIEHQLGRGAHAFWSPRRIDIDLLFWNDLRIDDDELRLPHPRVGGRAFVLQPLRDLLPDLPIRTLLPEADEQSLAAWCARLPTPPPLRTRPDPRSPSLASARWMGVLNLTPDSFSDGGRYLAPDDALHHARALLADGAHVLDLGAESTRPGAQPVPPEQEWARLAPVIEALLEDPQLGLDGARLCVDTRRASTAVRCLTLGVPWINDVSGGADPALTAAVCEAGATLVVMHSLSVPADPKQVLPADQDPVDVVRRWIDDRVAAWTTLGGDPARLVLDPGIGFGKTAAQSWTLIRRIEELVRHAHDAGSPLLVGHSRKSFLADLGERTAAERDLETVLVSRHLSARRVDFVRVHDVAAHVRMGRVEQSMG